MPYFRASVKEIDNGFLLDCSPKLAEHEQSFAPTFPRAIEWIVNQRNKYYPEKAPETKITVIVPESLSSRRVSLEARKKPLAVPTQIPKIPSEAAVKYTKLAGLIKKDYLEYLKSFIVNFPGDYPDQALELAHCKVMDGKVVFMGEAKP